MHGDTYIASFDIGKKNFAFYIERFDSKKLDRISNIPKEGRYNPDGTPTKEMEQLLNAIYLNGETILHKNLDLTKNCNPKEQLDPETYHNMIDVLDKYIEYFDKCSVFLIEQQMHFGKGKNNTMAVKLGQHCYSYFAFKYGRHKEIIEFPAYYKTQILGAEKIKGKKTKKGWRWKAMDKPARKKWAIKKAIDILEYRNETHIMQGIKTVKKRDDLADTFLMLQAAKYKIYVDKSL